MPAQADVHALADVPSQSTAHDRSDVPTRGDYEAVAKRTRLASARSSTCLVKKSCHCLTTKLAKELSSPRRALEVAGAAAEVLVPIVATHEVVSNVATLVAVTPEIVSKAAPITFELDVVILTNLGISAIPLPSVMIPGMTTPPHSPITRLVSSHKFNSNIFFSTFFCSRLYVIDRILGVGSPWSRSASDWSFSSERVDYSGKVAMVVMMVHCI